MGPVLKSIWLLKTWISEIKAERVVNAVDMSAWDRIVRASWALGCLEISDSQDAILERAREPSGETGETASDARDAVTFTKSCFSESETMEDGTGFEGYEPMVDGWKRES